MGKHSFPDKGVPKCNLGTRGKIYARDDIWNAVDPVYREFLRRYPHSIGFRTAYAEHAFDGDHFDIAREQLKLLGDEWDRDTITQSKYENMKSVLNPMDGK